MALTEFEKQTAIELKSDNPRYFHSNTHRTIRVTDGELVIYNGNFHLLENVQGLGIGALALAIQIRACIEVGIVRLDAYAAGVHGAEMNGYYVWPRLGYDARIPGERWHKFGAEALDELGLDFNKPGWVSDLIRSSKGASLWRTMGQGLLVALLTDSDFARDLLSAFEKLNVTVAESPNRFSKFEPFDLSSLPSVSSYKQRAAVQYRVDTSDQLNAIDAATAELVRDVAQPDVDE